MSVNYNLDKSKIMSIRPPLHTHATKFDSAASNFRAHHWYRKNIPKTANSDNLFIISNFELSIELNSAMCYKLEMGSTNSKHTWTLNQFNGL